MRRSVLWSVLTAAALLPVALVAPAAAVGNPGLPGAGHGLAAAADRVTADLDESDSPWIDQISEKRHTIVGPEGAQLGIAAAAQP